MEIREQMFHKIREFEDLIADFTGAPYVVTTDCCTHAIELSFISTGYKYTQFSAYTYLSVLMTMHKINIKYKLLNRRWLGEYRFNETNIWDSARKLTPKMYRKGMLQCLSFGYSKPLDIGRGGAILLDDYELYKELSKLRYDGRDLTISPWQNQETFHLGYHYKLNPEECIRGIKALKKYKNRNEFTIEHYDYPDCRKINIEK